MTIELGLIGSLLGLGLFFCGLLLANKVTGFGANPAAIAVVSTITFLVGLIPSVGGIIAIVSQYVMLKKINPEGAVIFTMLVSIITTALVFAFAVKLI